MSHEEASLVGKHADIVAGFKTEVCDNFEEIDGGSDLDWFALSIGYFIGKGVPIEIVDKLSSIVRYKLQYWEMYSKYDAKRQL